MVGVCGMRSHLFQDGLVEGDVDEGGLMECVSKCCVVYPRRDNCGRV